jgi:hypothetical protein
MQSAHRHRQPAHYWAAVAVAVVPANPALPVAAVIAVYLYFDALA